MPALPAMFHDGGVAAADDLTDDSVYRNFERSALVSKPARRHTTASAGYRSMLRSSWLNAASLRRLSSHSRSRAEAVTRCSLSSGIVCSILFD